MTAYIRVFLIDANDALVQRSVCLDNNCVRIGTMPGRKIIPVEEGFHRVWLDGVQDYYYPSVPPQAFWEGDIQTLDIGHPLEITFRVSPNVLNPVVKHCCGNG